MYISENCQWTPYGTDPILDREVDDWESWVRRKRAEQRYGLDKLINDKDEYVREAVAKQGYGLDILVNDEHWRVRAAVAKQGYGLDKLFNDKDENVRQAYRNYLREHNLTINQWVEQNPDKWANHKDSSVEKAIRDLIYKIDDSNKLKVQSQYDSVDKFFDSDIEDDIKMNTLVVCSVDSKTPLFKIEKNNVNEKINYKFIIDITNENNDNFSIKSTIQSEEQLTNLIQQTIDFLQNYSQFSKYVDDLENCL